MEIIKRKISLDEYISKKADKSWGQMTATTFYVNVFFKQDMDDMGIGTNLDYIENITATTVMNEHFPDTRYTNKTLSDYFGPTLFITGTTSDRLDLVKSYSITQKYQVGLDMLSKLTTGATGNIYTSVDKVISDDNKMPITYVIGGDNTETIDPNNPNQNTGIFFKTYSGITNLGAPLTEMYYNSEGFNETNTTLSAITKDEYLFGITTSPSVYSDVNIDRGRNSAFQSHLQLGEIKNMRDLINYGNGYYKIQKL